MAWRKRERQRLLDERRAVAQAQRLEWDAQIIQHLLQIVGKLEPGTVSIYWPFRAEPDLRPFLTELSSQGIRTALPVVVEKNRPLVFRSWMTGEELERGIWNILVPASGNEVVPDVVIAPVVGFDGDNFRLGYGGGYFDRTLASLAEKPNVVGVGYSMAEIATIHPLPHDIAMDMVVTENGPSEPPSSQ